MALPTKITMLNQSEGYDTFRNGGKGSGNFGHSGRPGKVGGSGEGVGIKYDPSVELEKSGVVKAEALLDGYKELGGLSEDTYEIVSFYVTEARSAIETNLRDLTVDDLEESSREGRDISKKFGGTSDLGQQVGQIAAWYDEQIRKLDK